MDLSELFTSKAKYRVLGVLSRRYSPVHLRELAELSEIQIRSCQLAVNGLLEKKLLIKDKDKNRVTFILNDKSPYAATLRAYFSEEELRKVEERSKQEKVPDDLLLRIHELRMLSFNVKHKQ